MSMPPMPSFIDLVHQAHNYEQLSRSMDSAPSAMPTFAVDKRSASSQRRSNSHLGVSGSNLRFIWAFQFKNKMGHVEEPG
ncbi:hypothetical protein ACS0TY_018939 [Phlomoides rotata]